MYLLSSAQQRSDPVFTFTTLLGTKPLAYGKFTKDFKWLLKQLGLGTGYNSHTLRRGKLWLQIGIPGEMIKLINS